MNWTAPKEYPDSTRSATLDRDLAATSREVIRGALILAGREIAEIEAEPAPSREQWRRLDSLLEVERMLRAELVRRDPVAA
jgi:hypothetical protein